MALWSETVRAVRPRLQKMSDRIVVVISSSSSCCCLKLRRSQRRVAQHVLRPGSGVAGWEGRFRWRRRRRRRRGQRPHSAGVPSAPRILPLPTVARQRPRDHSAQPVTQHLYRSAVRRLIDICLSLCQWRRALKVAICRQTAANFRKRRLCMLEIKFSAWIFFSKWGLFESQFLHFWTKIFWHIYNKFLTAQNLRKQLPSFCLRPRFWFDLLRI